MLLCQMCKLLCYSNNSHYLITLNSSIFNVSAFGYHRGKSVTVVCLCLARVLKSEYYNFSTFVLFNRPTFRELGCIHIDTYEYEFLYPCAVYSKHKFACIQMAAVHINMSAVRVQFALVWVVSAWAMFLGNLHGPCF